MLSQTTKEFSSFQLHHSHILKMKAFKMNVMNVRGQLIYNFAVIASPVFQVGIFFKRKKKYCKVKGLLLAKTKQKLREKTFPSGD